MASHNWSSKTIVVNGVGLSMPFLLPNVEDQHFILDLHLCREWTMSKEPQCLLLWDKLRLTPALRPVRLGSLLVVAVLLA